MAENPLWLNNEIQFARLLCELRATHETLDFDVLAAAMDLQPVEVESLFDRADDAWELAKSKMTLQEKIDHLDGLPGMIALYWIMENVAEDDPDRSQLSFYARSRVRRYQSDYKTELKFDRQRFDT